MVSADIRTRGTKVRQSVENNAFYASDELIEFAREFAVNRKLLHKAVFLRRQYDQGQEIAYRADLTQKMLQLVDAVIEDGSNPDEELKALGQRRSDYLAGQRGVTIAPERVLHCKKIGFRYPNDEFYLRGVDLDLNLREVTGVVGQNANGKTTLLRILVGERAQTEGTLEYPYLNPGRGTDTDWISVKRQIAYVPQDLAPWRGSLEENLRYEAAINGILGRDNDREYEFIVSRLGLVEELGKSWKALSGGFKLRFAIARALISKPRFLVLDEPLANLDFRAQLTILRDIRDLAKSVTDPMAVVITSQHLHEVEAVANNILFLTAGRVVFNGPIADIGNKRDANMYELGVEMEFDDLQRKLRNSDVKRITFDGMSYIVSTKLALEPKGFLKLLMDRDISVTYFRDISRSVKQLFETTEPSS